MNEKELLQSLEYIDDAYLLEAEQAMGAKKSWHLARRLTMLVAAVMVLVLTASAAYLVANWDEVFVDRFQPTEAVLAQSKDAIQEVAAMIQSKDAKMSIHQTLGDETYLYLKLDLTLPDSIDLHDYVTRDEETGEYRSLIMLGDIQVFGKPARYPEIRSMDYEELCRYFGAAEVCDSISVQNENVNPDTNTLTYLVGLSAMEGAKLTGDLTMAVADVTDFGTDKVLLEGPFVISWTAVNDSDVYRFDLKEKGKSIGSAVLSAFSLQVHLNESDYSDIGELSKTVEIVYRDGTVSAPKGVCGGSMTQPVGAIKLDWEFDEIQLLDEIVEIHVGDFVCKLAEN